MRIKCDEKLKPFIAEVKKVAIFFRSQIDEDFIFSAKLNRLQVSIQEDELIEGGDYQNLKINLRFNTFTPRQTIEYITAHELAHMLFDYSIKFRDFCASDNSYAVNTVQRISGTTRYGSRLEENLAVYFGIMIVSKMNSISYDEATQYVPGIDYIKEELTLTERLIQIFDLDNQTSKALYTTFDEIVKSDDSYITPRNLLLYQVTSGYSLSNLISEYDEKMGIGAWKRLMIWFDKKIFDNINVELSLIELR